MAVTYQSLVLIVKGWFTFLASHGSVMFAVSLFMVWQKRQYLRQIDLRPSVIRASVLTGVGCLMLVSGRLSGTMSLEKLSIIIMLLGLVLHVGGTPYLRSLYVPILYLVFTISVFDTILSGQLIYIQKVSAYIGANVLAFAGLPVLRNGITIALPHITMDVETACSGINHIIALVGLAIPLATITQKTRRRRIILVLEALLIGILANGLRVAGIGLWTHFNKNASVHGPSDVFLVSFIFGFGCVALIGLSVFQGRISFKRIAGRSIKQETTQTQGNSKRVFAGFISGALILGITGGYLYFYRIKPVYLNADFNEIPTVMGDWIGRNIYEGGVSLEGIRPDSELKRTYHNAEGGRIHVYVGYFAKQDREKKVFLPEYASFKGNEEFTDMLADEEVSWKLNYRKNQKGNTYLAYIIDGKTISRPSIAKLAIFRKTLVNGRSNAGIIIVETEGNGSQHYTLKEMKNELRFIKEIVERIVFVVNARKPEA